MNVIFFSLSVLFSCTQLIHTMEHTTEKSTAELYEEKHDQLKKELKAYTKEKGFCEVKLAKLMDFMILDKQTQEYVYNAEKANLFIDMFASDLDSLTLAPTLYAETTAPYRGSDDIIGLTNINELHRIFAARALRKEEMVASHMIKNTTELLRAAQEGRARCKKELTLLNSQN